ncbi:hypothetical protein D9757_002898 [Collybiopsis confluens]|uniref:t-SNARE coiled-coil homology domain-containing protein n=1 Tax=Collybiopsis confluens TaxID=2823264 RepID=A0A8H5MDS9_9AGAR|nr:hypothetical protein D9757_002898 [Collybiopsis confluens]
MFWRKNSSPIPPVESAGQTPSNGTLSVTSASIYNNSSVGDSYSRNRGVGDVYTRGGNLDHDRSELFGGHNASQATPGRFLDGSPPGAGDEDEDEVEGIKRQIRSVKQESVQSSRNALRLAREAEETARNTLGRLGDQSERLANTERHLDVSKGHSVRADDKTDELKQLNRSIFRPVVVFNKDAKRAAKEGQIQARYVEDRAEREKTTMDVRDSQNRIGRAQGYGRRRDEEELLSSGSVAARYRNAEQLGRRQEARKQYQFESNASDDELEDELDDNLDEIGSMTQRLKTLGMAMNQELQSQNKRIDTIEQKTVGLDGRLFRNTERLKRIK